MSTNHWSFPSVYIGPVHFTADHPAIIVPIVAETVQESLSKIDEALDYAHVEHIDVLEWRIDYVLPNNSVDTVVSGAQAIIDKLGSKRLLVTLRTTHEGGNYTPTDDEYLDIITRLVPTLSGHLVDVEYCRPKAVEAISGAHTHEVAVIGSFHDFEQTPTAAQITTHLHEMTRMGVDIAKIAVMPDSPSDVLDALGAGLRAAQKLHRPIMMISMGSLGMASRLSGGVFGSCATFAILDHASAPGQLPVHTVAQVRSAMN